MSGLEQALEVAIVDVEKAAEVIRLATATAFWKWRDDGKILLTKTKRLAVQIKQRDSRYTRWRKR